MRSTRNISPVMMPSDSPLFVSPALFFAKKSAEASFSAVRCVLMRNCGFSLFGASAPGSSSSGDAFLTSGFFRK